MRLILLYHGDPSIETVFGKTALIAIVENNRWDVFQLLYEVEPVICLETLDRGSSLSRDHQALLIQYSELVHLCRCVRTQATEDDL